MPEPKHLDGLDSGNALTFSREWTQDELHLHLVRHGWRPEALAFLAGGRLPQEVKFIDFEPLTDAAITRAKALIRIHRPIV